MARFEIEVEEREGFWGPVYWARIREWQEENLLWWNCGSEKARTPQKAEARARNRVKEILAKRERRAETEYTVQFEVPDSPPTVGPKGPAGNSGVYDMSKVWDMPEMF